MSTQFPQAEHYSGAGARAIDPLLGPPPMPASPADPQGPPTGPGTGHTAPLPPPPPPSARSPHRGARAVALVAVAALAGAGGGYVAASVADDNGVVEQVAAVPASVTTSNGIDVAAVIAAAQPSVVSVETQVVTQYGPFQAEGRGAGTGIVLDGGYVLTNAHVVEGAREITVTVAGESTARAAHVVGSDPDHDVAVVKVEDATGLVPAKLGDSDSVAVGDPVVAIGNALGLAGSPTVTQGIVSALHRSIGTNTSSSLTGLIQTDTAISSGNSGGPLVNADGDVIGINTAVAGSGGGVQASNVGFVIPINAAMAVAADWIS